MTTALAGLAGLVLCCLFVAPAKANEYEVWSCLGPAGQPLSMDAWRAQAIDAGPSEVWMTDDCATGGPAGLHVTDLGITGGRRARIDLRFNLPRDAVISGYSLNRAIRAAGAVSGYNYAAAVRETAAGIETNDGCASYLSPPSFNCSVLGSSTNPSDPGNTYGGTGLTLDGLSVWAGCYANGCLPPFMPPAAEFILFQSVVSIVDNDPPTLTALRGALSRSEPVSGVTDLYVGAADDNAGVRSVSLSVDGAAAETVTVDTSPTCAEPFEVPRPCPADTGLILPVDTSQLAPGLHSATGSITDAAGNSTPFGPVAFTVADPGPGPPVPPEPDNGTPAAEDVSLRLSRELFQHKPGGSATVTGLLTTGAGQAISGASLDVKSSSIGTRSTREAILPPVITGPDGRFSIPDKGRGARTIAVSYSPILGGVASRTASATVRSRLAIRLKATPRRIRKGKSVRFRGRIIGGGPSVAGANTEIQAISGGRWQTVANVSARRGGRFVWRYRFRFVERNALFSFRALVRGTPGWPWPTVKSKKVKVRIKVPRR
ncbi:MAG: carboxypeptidase-like regulatory domain-containing protein [Actinomycetota bacterium]|nr:carboxypeptidase-like regulatory domain-containing protein [Actinomycetota bacterium]